MIKKLERVGVGGGRSGNCVNIVLVYEILKEKKSFLTLKISQPKGHTST